MAATLTSKFTLLLDAVFQKTVGVASVAGAISKSPAVALANGTGLNQADLIYSETTTIAASGSETLDLAGVLTDIFGALITFVRIKALVCLADSGNTNNVLIGNSGVNAWPGPFSTPATETVAVRPGGWFIAFAPDATAWPVTAATGDQLKIANSGAGTGVTFDLVLIGASL